MHIAHRCQTILLALSNDLFDYDNEETLARPREIQWPKTSNQKHIEYADNIGILTNTCTNIQKKTKVLPKVSRLEAKQNARESTLATTTASKLKSMSLNA